jgi:hypothetical protein
MAHNKKPQYSIRKSFNEKTADGKKWILQNVHPRIGFLVV